MRPMPRPAAFPAIACTTALLLALASPAAAELVSEDSAFGADTITFDTETGLRWLDLTLTTSNTYDSLITAFGTGGEFEGYRLATSEEVFTLWENAQIDLTTDDWVPQNYAPIDQLTELVGVLANNGNCGAGCTFQWSQGWIDSGDPPPANKTIGTLQWFDNTTGLNPSLPLARIGRWREGSTSDPASTFRGGWIVQAPEPVAASQAAAVLAALGALGFSRSARSARRRPRARRR